LPHNFSKNKKTSEEGLGRKEKGNAPAKRKKEIEKQWRYSRGFAPFYI
jgi:hypothetical protein